MDISLFRSTYSNCPVCEPWSTVFYQGVIAGIIVSHAFFILLIKIDLKHKH